MTILGSITISQLGGDFILEQGERGVAGLLNPGRGRRALLRVCTALVEQLDHTDTLERGRTSAARAGLRSFMLDRFGDGGRVAGFKVGLLGLRDDNGLCISDGGLCIPISH